MSPIFTGTRFGFGRVDAPTTVSTTPNFASATISSDPGDAYFTAGTTVYNGAASDESSYEITLPFSVTFLGTSYSTIKVSSNSYLVFGAGVTLPSFSFTETNPSAPGIGVCAHPGSSTDTNVQFLAWRQDGSVVKLRWKGGYPYTFSTVNRIWDITFTSGSNQYLIECRTLTSKDSSGTGNVLTAKNASAFVAQSTTPSDGTAFTLTA